ncbi:hypothetical protein HNP49_002559 [Pseudomonas fluvialis]|uniref:Uncharacterized protein n=1 Tax=Pseudomonas fluvialis TaxID=1793966 RepID=A0A7X0ESC1_9PSED|nr:hypothetical protein [Pseudomonas fluvialis]MBB6342377.1 hypothetical protein [Pseudomonas fluvialis]
MAKRKVGLEWLDTSDEQAVNWAYNYLQQHGKPVPGNHGQRNAETLLKKGLRIEEAVDGRQFLSTMRNAYRQQKWRLTKPGLKNRTFRLHTPVAAKLDSLAKQERVRPTDLVETLIAETAKAHAGISKKLKESKERENREKGHANLREKGLKACVTALEEMLSDALMRISYYETVCGTPTDVHGPLSSHYQQAWSEAQQKLNAIRKQHAGPHNHKRALDRPEQMTRPNQPPPNGNQDVGQRVGQKNTIK